VKRTLIVGLALALSAVIVPARAELRIVAFGDSITDGFGDPAGTGYPRRLQKILENALEDSVKVVKSAVPGEETSEALSRISSALAGGGDQLLLMEGTNDVTAIAQGRVSIETVLQNLDNLARTGERRGYEVVHATIFPRSPYALRDSDNIRTGFVVREIRDLAYVRKRKMVDVFEAFDPEIVDDLYDQYFYADADPVGHPNEAGYERMARVFADVLLEVDTVPPVVGPWTPGPLPSEIPADIEIRVPIYETLGASGIDNKASTLLINGREAGSSEGNRRRLHLVFQDEDAIGCRVVLAVRSEDRADPPNSSVRLLGIFEVADRKVLPGDVDFDCRVDGFDLVSFAWGFGSQFGDERYQRRLDLTLDGVIDGEDLAILAKNFSRSSL
jgi:lysophospholipase L1-like esterase